MNLPIDISPELAQSIKQLCALPVPVRLHIMEMIEQSLPRQLEDYFAPEQIAEIDRRLNDHFANPEFGLTLEEVRAQLWKKS